MAEIFRPADLEPGEPYAFGVALMLGLAYSASKPAPRRPSARMAYGSFQLL